MKSRSSWTKLGIIAFVLVSMIVVVAACGGTTETTGTSATTVAPSTETTATPTTVGLGDYNGIDKEFIAELAEPVKKPDLQFKVGFLLNNGAVNTLVAIQNAAEARITELGGEFIAYDAATDAQKQVSQMDTLISQKVDAILAYSITDATLTQGIQNAKAAGIPVIQVEVPTNPETPVNPASVALVTIAHDLGCYETMKYISEQTPGAKVAFMGYAPPNEAIVHIMDRGHFWAKEFGLNILPDETSAINPSPPAASDAAQSILAKHPDADYIITFNDVSAMATVAVLKTAGNTTIKVATPNGGDAITAPAIKDGSVIAAWQGPFVKLGDQAAIAAYNVITNQNLPLQQRIMIPGILATKDNVDTIEFIQ